MKHLVAECNQRAVCRTCGKDHQTVECAKTEREAFWCISCNVSGHVSWDRLCPGFLAASKRMEEADPKHTYKYFPRQEAWTWEQQPGYMDNRPAAWCGPLSVNGLTHEAW